MCRGKKEKKEGPDQGWSWVILFSSFMISFIMSGIVRMSAVLYVEMIPFYGISRQEATLPFSVRLSIRSVIGPMVGMLGHRYGIRKVTVVGTVIAIIGTLLCYTANDITWIIVYWGVIAGFGFGMANTLHYAIINLYFVKYRAFASGISCSGGCVGAFVFPAVIEASIETYGLRGTYLLMSAIIMNTLPVGMLLRPPSWLQNKQMDTTSPPMKEVRAGGADQQGKPNIAYVVSDDEVNSDHLSAGRALTNETKASQELKELPLNVAQLERKGFDENCTKPSVPSSLLENKNSKLKIKSRRQSIAGQFKTQFRVITDLFFMYISVTEAVFVFAVLPFVTVVLDYAADKGIESTNGKYILFAFSISEVLGRLCFGWTIDKGIFTVKTFTTISFISLGGIMFIFPLVNSFTTFMVLSVLYGMADGMVLIMIPLQIGHYMKPEQQSHAIGSMMFISGVLTFAMPPMIGYFRDTIGCYDGMIYVTGGLAVFGGLFWLTEPLAYKIRRRTSAICTHL